MKHDVIDARSLELHRCIAKKLLEDPSLLSIPRNNIQRWLSKDCGSSTAAYLEWKCILTHPLEEITKIILADDEKGRRRRQATPFTGILSEREREEIMRKWES